MLWVTRSHVHVDRVACPWLITRFIDNRAEFLFVPASEVEKIAGETGAIPFDAPGVELGHVEGRCSFESIITRYGLKEPGLLRLAKIVHAAERFEQQIIIPYIKWYKMIILVKGIPWSPSNPRRVPPP